MLLWFKAVDLPILGKSSTVTVCFVEFVLPLLLVNFICCSVVLVAVFSFFRIFVFFSSMGPTYFVGTVSKRAMAAIFLAIALLSVPYSSNDSAEP